MSKKKVREPVQQRAIETKQQIVQAGFKLFCEKGFHKTNTAEIAKEAGVSTGIVYNYFSNKKAIFLDVIMFYGNLIVKPTYEKLKTIKADDDPRELINEIIAAILKSHTIAKDAHSEMMSMAQSDRDVGKIISEFDEEVRKEIVKALLGIGYNIPNINERVHIAQGLVENYCHEIIYNKKENVDYAVMHQLIVDQILYLLSFNPQESFNQ